jgi:SAM-dependent methyltransferase
VWQKERMDQKAWSYLLNPKSIKFYVKKYFDDSKAEYRGKTLIDCPAGSGVISRYLSQNGVTVRPFDIFPEYFQAEELNCQNGDLSEKLPVEDGSADVFICQEGIEHLADPVHLFREAHRILRVGGELIITTPSYSNLKGKLSYLINESENYSKMMPPNRIDTVWQEGSGSDSRVYFGHAFLLGIQKLRFFSEITGFSDFKFIPTRRNSTSLFLFCLFYPLIWFYSFVSYQKTLKKLKKSKGTVSAKEKDYLKSIYEMNISPTILTDSHIFISCKKADKEGPVGFDSSKSVAFHDAT